MNPAQVLELLADRQIVVVPGPTGPVLDGPLGSVTPELVEACRRYRWVFTWGLAGKSTRHVWHVCTDCGQCQLRRRSSRPARCVFTPGCSGAMKPGPDVFSPPEQLTTAEAS